MPYYTYILTCVDKTLYTGSTINLEKRIIDHNTHKNGAKYTRARRPVTISYHETFATLHEARVRENEIKKLSRKEKILLIKTYSDQNDRLTLIDRTDQ